MSVSSLKTRCWKLRRVPCSEFVMMTRFTCRCDDKCGRRSPRLDNREHFQMLRYWLQLQIVFANDLEPIYGLHSQL